MDHLVHCMIESKVEFIVCSGSKASLFNLRTCMPNCHFMEDRAYYVSKVLRMCSNGDLMCVVGERKMVDRSSRHCGDGSSQ